MASASQMYGFVLALLFAVAAGLVGSFALMKRMLLAGDVMSHLALPGLAIAFLLGFPPLLGAALSLLVGTLMVAHLQKTTGLAADAMIAVVFAGSLAIGALLTPEGDLVEALFGSFQRLTFFSFLVGLFAICIIVLAMTRLKNALVLSTFSPELAASSGIRLDRLNLYFLLIFSLTILIGLRFMGALLAGALIMLPAAIGRRMSNDLKGFLLASSTSSVCAVALGFLLSTFLFRGQSLGTTTTLAAAGLFALSLLRRGS